MATALCDASRCARYGGDTAYARSPQVPRPSAAMRFQVAASAAAVRSPNRDGTIEAWTATAAVETAHEVKLLRAGGVLPAILRRELASTMATTTDEAPTLEEPTPP